MVSLKKLFATSGKKFYAHFLEVANNLEQIADVFLKYVQETDRVNKKRILDEIEAIENRNDTVTHKLFVELGRNYITPFDREDIHSLASSLDDIADNIWGTSKQMYYYHIDYDSNEVDEFANQLKMFSVHLRTALTGLQNRSKLSELMEMLNNMRSVSSKCDDLVSNLLFSLFDEGNDKEAVDVIKLTDHYNMLQVVCNKCGEAINVLENVVIKYA